jgi:vanillate O-demethylase ferredoxin subunit
LLRARLSPLPDLLESAEAMSGPSEWLEVRVARRWPEALDVVALELVASGSALPPFTAGSYIDVLTPSGVLRPYSLCNAPHERHRYLIAVLREASGGGAASIHEQVRVGDRLRIRAPRNEFALRTVAVHSLLLAGGIGVTPLLAMANDLWRRASPFLLHYCARNPERAAFHAQDAAFLGCVRFHWSERCGRADLRRLIAIAPVGADVYACGPTSFLRDAQRAFHALGREPSRWHCESFQAVPSAAWAG